MMRASLPTWIEVRVVAPEDWLELVAEALVLGPRDSIAFGRPSLGTAPPAAGLEYVRASYPSEEDGDTRRAEIALRLGRLADAVGAPELAGLKATFHILPPEDWATSWRKSWKPMRVGRFALVLPEHDGPLRAGDLRLELEPGIAFGTGRHPTTRQCLAAISARPLRDARVLDAGTGSGLLAVAAVLAGARFAFGFDIDPACERVAVELAERNGVRDRCHFATGGFEALEGPRAGRVDGFDAVLANIYADLLQRHASTVAKVLHPGGWFAFAGCSAPGAPGTRTAIAAAGLELEQEPVRGRWHGFHGTRPRAARPAAG